MSAPRAFRRLLVAVLSSLAFVAALLAPTPLTTTPTASAAIGDGVYGCDYSRSNKRIVKVYNDRQMQNAVKNRRGGDRILVMNNGHYSQLPIMSGRGGWEGNWITIAAAPGKSPKIAGRDWAAVDIREPYIQVCGFEVWGTSNSTNWNDTTRVGIYVGATHHVRVADNFVHNFSLGGININYSNNLDVVGNVVKWNSFWGKEQGSGISIFQPSDAIGSFDKREGKYQIRIAGNVVSGNANRVVSNKSWDDYGQAVATDGNGIIIDDLEQLQVPSNQRNAYDGWVLVANNVVYKNGGRGIHAGPNGGRRIHIINNTSYHNMQTVREGYVRYDNFGRGEITVFGTQHQTSWEMRVVNNIAIVDPNLKADWANVMAFYRGNIPDWTIIAHHNSFNGRAVKGTFNYPGLANSEEAHKLGNGSQQNANPPFQNPSRGNFRLTNNWISGSNSTNGTVDWVDIDGRNRPSGRRQERGAYEYRTRY